MLPTHNYCIQDGAVHLEEEAVSGLVRGMRREARANPLLVAGMLLDCAVQLSPKAPVYALLVGEPSQPDAVGGGRRADVGRGHERELQEWGPCCMHAAFGLGCVPVHATARFSRSSLLCCSPLSALRFSFDPTITQAC